MNDSMNVNNKKEKKTAIIVAIVIILVFGSLSFLVLGNLSKNNYNEEDNYNENTDNSSSNNEWYTPTKSDYKIDVHYDIKNQNYSNVHFKTDNTSDGEVLSTYYCTSSSCKAEAISEKGYVLINDIGYVIYDYMTNKATKLDLTYISSDVVRLYIKFLEKDDKLKGIYFKDSKASHFIPVGNGKPILMDSSSYTTAEIEDDYLVVANKNVINYYNLENGTLDKTLDVKVDGDVELIPKNKNLLYVDNNYTNDSGYITVYNNNMDAVLKFQSAWYYIDDENIYFYNLKKENQSLDKYDSSGKLVKQIDNIKLVSNIENGYSFMLDNENKLKLIDLNNNVIEEFETISDGSAAFYQRLGEEFPYGVFGYDKNRNFIIKVSARTKSSGSHTSYRTYIYNTVTGEKSSVDA